LRIRNGFWLLAALLALPLAGCTREAAGVVPEEERNAVSLALNFSISRTQAQAPTKMTPSVVQEDQSFRGLDEVVVIPFRTADPSVISSSETVFGIPTQMDPLGTGDLVSGSNAHLYPWIHLWVETNAALAYAKAPDEAVPVVEGDSVAFKRRNGVLRHPPFYAVHSSKDMVFTLERFLNADTYKTDKTNYETWRKNLANYLNWSCKASVTSSSPKRTYRFNYPSDYNRHPGLMAAFNKFTNYGIMSPGSHEVLDKRLTDLYRDVYPYAEKKQNSEDYHDGTYYYVYELANKILKELNNANYVTITGSGTTAEVHLKRQAPACWGLPAGAYALQYREGAHQFDQMLDNNDRGVDHRVGLFTTDERFFTYPPALYYYSNSPLLTSDSSDAASQYTGDKGPWSNILNFYPDRFVKSTSRSAAIANPLQYGVARLDVKIKKISFDWLEDDSGTVAVSDGSFPLTGVLVAGQKAVDYNFDPIATADNYIVYDADTWDENTPRAPRAYISSTESSTVSVLLLPSEQSQDVNFALEFLNNSSRTFHGINGCEVLPGMHFYLLGRLNLTAAIGTGDRVFSKGLVTTVNVTVPNLKFAHTILPDLRQPQLSIGLVAQLNWYQTTPVMIEVQ